MIINICHPVFCELNKYSLIACIRNYWHAYYWTLTLVLQGILTLINANKSVIGHKNRPFRSFNVPAAHCTSTLITFTLISLLSLKGLSHFAILWATTADSDWCPMSPENRQVVRQAAPRYVTAHHHASPLDRARVTVRQHRTAACDVTAVKWRQCTSTRDTIRQDTTGYVIWGAWRHLIDQLPYKRDAPRRIVTQDNVRVTRGDARWRKIN